MNAVMLVEDGCRHKVLWSGEWKRSEIREKLRNELYKKKDDIEFVNGVIIFAKTEENWKLILESCNNTCICGDTWYSEVPMMDETIKYILSRIIDNANDAIMESREHPDDDFYKGKKLAYYEVLDTIKNELIAKDQNLKEFGLDINLEEAIL